MPCIQPIAVHQGKLELWQMVRCGKCDYCINRWRHAWIGRMILENMDHEHSRFLTLTYAVNPGSLIKEHVQLFLKRYRKHYGECRFVAVGEYGERKGRPHWHIIIYGHPPQSIGAWHDNKAWKHGFTSDGKVTEKSILYLAKYLSKNVDPIRPPVVLRSLRPGIGLDKIRKLGEYVGKTNPNIEAWPYWYNIGNKHYPLLDTGVEAFQQAYINAGGCPPATLTPDDRHVLTLDALADLGTRVNAERRQREQHFRRRGQHGLTPQ